MKPAKLNNLILKFNKFFFIHLAIQLWMKDLLCVKRYWTHVWLQWKWLLSWETMLAFGFLFLFSPMFLNYSHVWEFLYMCLYEWNVWTYYQCLIWFCNDYDEAVSSESATQSCLEKNTLRNATFPSAFEVSIFPQELFLPYIHIQFSVLIVAY